MKSIHPCPRVRAVWGIGYIKRKLHERRAEYQAQTPEEKAAWRTANATLWIAIFTVVLAIVGGITLYEVMSGANDTHELALQAKNQADASKAIAIQAKAQTDRMSESLTKTDALIEATNKLAAQASITNQFGEESTRGRIAIKDVRLQRPIVPGELIGAVIEKDNIGHATVLEESVAQSEHWISLPDGDMPLTKEPNKMALEPGDQSAILIFDKAPATKEFIDGISRPGMPTIYFFGRIEYQSFGRRHKIEFCFYALRADTSAIPTTPASSSAKVDPNFILYRCPKWHTEY